MGSRSLCVFAFRVVGLIMPKNRDTTAATAARTRKKHDRWAAEMRAAGWLVLEPENAKQAGEGAA